MLDYRGEGRSDPGRCPRRSRSANFTAVSEPNCRKGPRFTTRVFKVSAPTLEEAGLVAEGTRPPSERRSRERGRQASASADGPNGSKRREAPLGAMTPPDAVTVQTLEAILAAFNRNDLDAIMGYFSEVCTFDFPRGPHPWGNRYVGKSNVRAGLARRFEGLPDVHYGEDRHWVAGHRGVSEWLLTGTTPQGEKVRVQGCDLWEFEGGKVVRKDSYWKIVEK